MVVWVGFAVCWAATAASGQGRRPFIVRVEAGSLHPSVLLQTTLAVGATLGWQRTDRGAVLLRYLRQSQRGEGTDVGRDARNFVMLNWELAFGEGGKYKRQLLLRAGGGALFRPLLHTAPLLGAGLEVRYPVAPRWALLANIEDDAAALPRQDVTVCDPLRGCVLRHFDSKLEQNFGLIVAGEWRF